MTQQEVQSVITDEMRAAIGKEGEPSTLEVDKTGCRMFARAVGHTDPIFYDEEYAQKKGHRSVVAPPGFLGTRAFSPAAGGGAQGRPGMGFSIPYKRVLNGGTETEYYDTVCAGDVLTARNKVTAFNERSGSMGPMLITSRETTYTNQDGKVVAVERGTVIQY
jgi:acyl dehydratase